jgi:hypothetical protein
MDDEFAGIAGYCEVALLETEFGIAIFLVIAPFNFAAGCGFGA